MARAMEEVSTIDTFKYDPLLLDESFSSFSWFPSKPCSGSTVTQLTQSSSKTIAHSYCAFFL
jgi:hypothetical protein